MIRSAAWVLALAGALCAASCASVARIPAKGTLHGTPIDTTVDSEVARYYVETYLQGKQSDRDLHRRIDALGSRYRDTIPSREELAVVSTDYSVDFAALFFAGRLLRDECNRQLNETFAAYRNDPGKLRARTAPYVVLFVPGWDYAENGHVTGADFARPRKLAAAVGLDNELVPLPPTGSVEENAAVVAREIGKRAGSGKKILVAGASSAGPAIHLALGELLSKRDLDSVAAWLNLGGILQGSPVIDYYESGPRSLLLDLVTWAKGWRREAIHSMGTVAGRRRFERLRIDADLLVVNYLGIPLSGQVSRFASDKYPILRREGPNDGLTLLPDAIAPNSITIVALGRDHFFAEDPDIDRKTYALMASVIAYAERSELAGCASRRARGAPG